MKGGMVFMSKTKQVSSHSSKYSQSDLDLAIEINRKRKMDTLRERYQDKIKNRSDGRQVYIYINRKQISAKDKEALMNKLFEINYGTDNYTMNDIFPLLLLWKRDKTATKGKTLKDYSQKWKNHFKCYDIVNIPIKHLTPKHFVDLFNEWTKERRLTRKAFNNYKSIINAIFQYAINELGIVEVNPIREIDMRQFPMKPPTIKKENVFTLEERKQMIKHLQNTMETGLDQLYSLAIQFDFYVTLRIGELKALKWENYRDGKIYVEGQHLLTTQMLDNGSFSPEEYENSDFTKGITEAGYRWLHLPDEAKKILELVRQINPDGEYIFMYDGMQLNTSYFNDHLRKHCELLNINPKDKSSHSIRFSVASTLYHDGVSLPEIQRMLGHTTLQMTLHYLRNVLSDGEHEIKINRSLCISEENSSTDNKDMKNNKTSEALENASNKDKLGMESKIISVLKEYKELLDSGIISKEEFDKKKQELLSYKTS